jgi:proprotein convertase subtilisin/kexin type 5
VFVQGNVCGTNCVLCANNLYCYACASPYVLLNNGCAGSCGNLFVQVQNSFTSCVSACSDGFFPKVENNKRNCQACTAPCRTCLDATSCLSCVTGQSLYYDDLQNKCLGAGDSCSSGFFKDASTFTCAKCVTPCLTCSSQKECLSCAVGFFTANSCKGTCPAGTFANQVTNACTVCSNTCATCTNSAANCLSCVAASANKYLLNNQCLSACPIGFFPNTVDGSSLCTLCHQSCSSCAGDGASLCTACVFFNLNILDRTANTGNCVADCPAFFFASNLRCEPCQLPCSTCTSTSVCRDCSPIASNTNNIFHQGACLASACPTGFYTRS